MPHLDGRPLALTVICSLFLVLSWIAVTLRFYVRGILIKAIGADDYIALAGAVVFSLLNIGGIFSAHSGFGLHVTELTFSQLYTIFKLWYLVSIAYVVCLAAIKISICLSLHRIAIEQWHYWTIYITAALTIIISIATCAVSIFQCSPIPYFWTRFAGAQGRCLSDSIIADVAWMQSAVSVVTDWTLAILPFFMIWNLPMGFKTKLSVYLVLALGSIACIATIVRIPTFKHLSDTEDFTYAAYYLGILSIIEPGIGLTACCLVTMRPLLRKLFNISSTRGNTSSHSCPSSGPGFRTKKNSNPLGVDRDDMELRQDDAAGGTGISWGSSENNHDEEHGKGASEIGETAVETMEGRGALGSR